ncbi:MAG: Coenzyme F420 hydrogenase/dehydrogenase, beta subunit C-terminal domain, partial [Clostridia bacterium]|nr:Coenzyme F420 hydrogenase/dehydrogenase, beta subunit C-terminal domain [Clostridia bacterium]
MLPEKDCVGCASCANICPVNAISMQPDAEGFLYPIINKGNCVNCDKCINHCPVISGVADDFNNDEEPLAVYFGWSLDKEPRLSSSSGGIFAEIAKNILKRKGYVVAVTYTDEHTAKHIIINSITELENLKRSKYLQSDIGNVYKDINHLLEWGSEVLFVGTPCQCAGLLSFLRNKPENLILVDFICHGVNSPLVHQRYISEVEQELNIKVKKINHRDKFICWENYVFSVSDTQKYCLGNKRQNPFLRGFLTDAYLRRSCYNCKF